MALVDHSAFEPRSGSGGLVVWVLEDDPVDQRLINAALAKADGVELPAVMARTAEEMLDLLDTAEQLPNLFLVDLNTPGEGGIGLTRSLRARNDVATVPIVVLTSSVNDRDQVDAAGAGVNAFHVKPFDWREFNDLIAMLIAYWSRHGVDAGR